MDEHDEWVRSAKLEPSQQSHKVVADGIRYVGADGIERWMTGSMLIASHIHASIRKAVNGKARRHPWNSKSAFELGKRYAVQREEIATLKAKIGELRAALPLRWIGGKSAA